MIYINDSPDCLLSTCEIFVDDVVCFALMLDRPKCMLYHMTFHKFSVIYKKFTFVLWMDVVMFPDVMIVI